MNRDQHNLNFLLKFCDNEEQFDNFINELDLDDIYYSIDLLQKHCSEILIKDLELIDVVKDVSQANDLITKIKNFGGTQ